jgi:hypothetical protein
MTSRERMHAALACAPLDYIPCSFMLFFNLYEKCATEEEYIERQCAMGLDAFVHVGHLNRRMHTAHVLHPEAVYNEWVEEINGVKFFCRRIDTPKGPLTGRVRQRGGWPTEEDFPLMKDWIVPRAEEILVKPEEDLEKVPYVFGPFRAEDIEALREEAVEAKRIADRHQLLLVGGYKGYVKPGLQLDPGVMGADAMAWLSGYVDVMILSQTKPDIIREYARIIHEWNIRQIEIYLDVTDAELIIRRAWYETTEFWTPASYHNVIYPFLKKEADLVHQAGKRYGYIITSAFIPIVDDILGAGVDVLIGLDPMEGKGTDLELVKNAFRKRKRALWGGVSGAVTVETGTKEQTEAAVVAALETLGKGGGFILSPVDNVREDTAKAWENTHVFIETWKNHRESAVR